MPLEGAYAFDEVGSGTVTDHSGNGRDITLTGTAGAQVADGGAFDGGGALGKTGATMPVLPASLLAACETDDRGIMFDAAGNLNVWWVRFEKDSIGSGVWGVLNIADAVMEVQARRAPDEALATRPSAALPGATRHNYCTTYVRSTGVISFYRDGALVSTSSFAAGTQLSVGANRINIAEWSDTGPAMDNLRFFSHAPDAAEVAALAGTPVEAEPPEPLDDGGDLDMQVRAIMAKVTSTVQSLGVFDTVNGGELTHVPGAGLRAAVWPSRISSPPGSSGLSSASVVMNVMVRVYGRVHSLPIDEIDEDMLDAVDQLCDAYVGGFTLGDLVRSVDLHGIYGQPMTVEAGYLDIQEGTCRVMTLTLPLIINDAWEEVA